MFEDQLSPPQSGKGSLRPLPAIASSDRSYLNSAFSILARKNSK